VSDVDDEAEMRLMQRHGVGLFEIGMRVDENSGKQGWSDNTLATLSALRLSFSFMLTYLYEMTCKEARRRCMYYAGLFLGSRTL